MLISYSKDMLINNVKLIMKIMQQSTEKTMPLFNPVYDSTFYKKFMELKTMIKENKYDYSTHKKAEYLLKLDPSNYNGWYAKKMAIINGLGNIQHEKQFSTQCLGQKAKSFQVWQHRRFLSERTQEYKKELEFINHILRQKDGRNYHAWSYRVWIVQKLGSYQQQLSFTEQMIEENEWNNSAWTFRFFLIEKLLQKQKNHEIRKEIVNQEIDFTFKHFELFTDNKSPWNYIRGFFPSIKIKEFNSPQVIQKENFNDYPKIEGLCLKFLEDSEQQKLKKSSKEKLEVIQAFEKQLQTFLVQIYSNSPQEKEKAIKICKSIEEKDRLGKNYWRWLSQNI